MVKSRMCNPTAIHRQVGALMKFQADVICASETSATSVIQKDVTRDMMNHMFSSFWSLPVAPKKNTIDAPDRRIEVKRRWISGFFLLAV